MGSKSSDTPVYRQFIGFLRKGFLALETDSRDEVKRFVQSCQHENGAFTNRTGKPDFYYSLFGVWLAAALGLDETLEKHKAFIEEQKNEKQRVVDSYSLWLIRLVISEHEFKKPSVFQLLNMTFLKGNRTNIFYRIFLFLLTFDAFYRSRLLRVLSRPALLFFSPSPDSPCSIIAATTVARHVAGLKTEKESELLLRYFDENKGFKVFKEANDADLLSTAVALFALQIVGAELRMVAPACLNQIQQNYSGGAFLAGNGDGMRDLEYTFYGLLALGILV